METILEQLKEVLIERSLRYGEFTLASGATSHYYCDAKLTLLSPRGAQLSGDALCRVLECCDVEAAGGLAMGAAYMATAIAAASAQRRRPIYGFTVRNDRKDHGRQQKIDESWIAGEASLITKGRRVAVVDDVITTGRSTIEALRAVEAVGCEVKAVVAILDRQAGGAAAFAELGLPFYSLFVADDEGRLTIGRLPEALSLASSWTG